jgi:hypothetical protein
MISISVTFEAPAFSISKAIGPAGAVASCGAQPWSVSLNAIFFAFAGVSSLDPQALRAAMQASASAARLI